ncbi:MAG: ATP-dependent helicase [Deltaproteobacteria bacterium]|nr:ATP-dependent helicase [Deltaproteobacteria bacterium]
MRRSEAMDFDSLSKTQREIVFSKEPHLLVWAGPGSGKTRVLSFRYARLVRDGVSPESILAITFTNRAAVEMKTRIAALLSLDCPASVRNVGTFHGFCLRLLKKKRSFTLISRPEQTKLLRGLGIKNAEKAVEDISTFKNLSFPDAGIQRPQALGPYEEELRKRNFLDLDDLIIKAAALLSEEPEFHPGFAHVLVDEFQDINPPQSELLGLLVNPTGRGGADLFAIGDPDQSIYSFRGASIKRFLNFRKDYPGASLMGLEANYRSAAVIVRAAASLIGKNPMEGFRRVMKEVRRPEEGETIEAVCLADERREAEFIIKEVERLMGGLTSLTVGRGCGGRRFSDFAVFFRTNRQREAIAGAFRGSSIPYICARNPDEFPEIIEHLKGIKADGAQGNINPCDFIRKEAKALGLDEGLASTLTFLAGSFGPDIGLNPFLSAFIESLILMQPQDTCAVEADRVQVMTLHAAKGLEFPVVFIAGCEDGLIPLKSNEDVEEERRLFYVGITRAKEKLYLLNSGKRCIFGSAREQRKSPFLDELPEGCLRYSAFAKERPKRRPRQKGLFEG